MCNNILKILFLFALFVYGFCQNAIEFRVAEANNNSLYCKDKGKIKSVTIIENQKLTLTVIVENKPTYINYLICQPNFVFQMNELRNKDKNNHTLLFPNRTTMNMSGIWNCTIRINKNSRIKPIYYDQQTTEYYTELNCSIRVQVKRPEPPVSVLVNGLQLYTQKFQTKSHNAVYQYATGDFANVLCVNAVMQYSPCEKIGMIYDQFIMYDDIFDTQWESDYGAGFRIRLTHEHDGNTMLCKCVKGFSNGTVVEVKFKLRTYHDDTSILRINGYPVREFLSYDLNAEEDYITVKYWTSQNENLSIAYENNSLTRDGNYCKMRALHNLDIIIANQSCNMGYQLMNGSYLELKIFQLPEIFYGKAKLSMDISKNVNFMSMYKLKRKEIILLQYKDGDVVNLTCSGYARGDNPHQLRNYVKTYINFNGTKLGMSDSISIQKHMNSSHNNKVMKCFLMNSDSNRVGRKKDYKINEIEIKFRQINKEEMSTNGYKDEYTSPVSGDENATPDSLENPMVENNDSFYLMIIIAGCVVTCIVLVCVIAIICKMKKKTPPKESNYENFENDTIPNHPPQWSQENHYHEPVDQKKDTIYAEPENNIEQPYATPIPKHLRPKKQKVLYASLEKFPAGGSQNKNSYQAPYATIAEVSAQRKDQASYDNVFGNSRYVNSNNTEYVEPTYCQPYVKK